MARGIDDEYIIQVCKEYYPNLVAEMRQILMKAWYNWVQDATEQEGNIAANNCEMTWEEVKDHIENKWEPGSVLLRVDTDEVLKNKLLALVDKEVENDKR